MNILNNLELNIYRIKGDVNGCSDTEIRELQNKLKVKLPEAYKEFLMLVGNGAGNLFDGSDIECSSISKMQEQANNILKRRTGKLLNKNNFVFFIHQDYSFCYFNLTDGDNPKVYTFIEPEEPAEIVLTNNSFSDFIDTELTAYFKTLEYLNS